MSTRGIPSNIILVGFMGAGKTSVARVLAQLLQYEFVDMDRVLEDREGMPVAGIFAVRGEAAFRSLERSLVAELTAKNRQVIATGGGAWLDESNQARFLKGGWCVWLKASSDPIWERVKDRISERPLLANSPDPKARIAELLEQRRAQYEKAPVHFDTDQRSPVELADLILQRLREDRPFDLPEL